MNPIKNFPTPLDVMRDGQEFECLVGHQFAPNFNIVGELRRSIAEVETTRKNMYSVMSPMLLEVV